MSASSLYPNARRANLVVEELQNEVLLYDLDRDQASCLNVTAALVWKYADGNTSADEIAARMAKELKTPVDSRVVWYAVDQLGKKNLLQERMIIPSQYARMTRRDFLTKAGIMGAAVAIPVIISLAAPTPAMAVTGCSGPCCTNPDPDICNPVVNCPVGCTCSNANGGTCQ